MCSTSYTRADILTHIATITDYYEMRQAFEFRVIEWEKRR